MDDLKVETMATAALVLDVARKDDEPAKAAETERSSPPTGGLDPESGEQSEVSVDPFAGFYQDNATIVEGEWGGYPAYRCSACPFDSLERATTQAHLSIHGQTYTQGA